SFPEFPGLRSGDAPDARVILPISPRRRDACRDAIASTGRRRPSEGDGKAGERDGSGRGGGEAEVGTAEDREAVVGRLDATDADDGDRGEGVPGEILDIEQPGWPFGAD